MIKKINSFCAGILTLFFLAHLGTMSYSMLTGWYNYNICKFLAHATAATIMVHLLLCLIVFFFLHDGATIRNYRARNARIMIQRISGIIVLLFIHTHVKAFGFIAEHMALESTPKIQILFTEIVFFGALFAHIAVSFSRAFITVGWIQNNRTEKWMDRMTYIVCGILYGITIFALTRFILFW